jgi:nucleotide-binding universal stress UspA family protein
VSTTTDSRARVRRPLDFAPSRVEACRAVPAQPDAAPIVIAVDNSRAATAAVQAAVSLGADLAAPLVFVYVRRGPSSALGEPYYQRRLDAEMASGRRALTDALAVAEEAGVPATGEQLAGKPARRVVEFARLRGARLVVLGSRQRRLRRGVARGVIRRRINLSWWPAARRWPRSGSPRDGCPLGARSVLIPIGPAALRGHDW